MNWLTKDIFPWARKNSANLITGLGIVLGLWVNVQVWRGSKDLSSIFWLAVAVALTDFFDGQVARRLKVTSELGSFLDKLRDKLFACPLFIFMFLEVWQKEVLFGLLSALVLAILLNEFLLLLIWLFVFFQSKGGAKANIYGKLKMAFYFLAICWWLLAKQFKGDADWRLETILALFLIAAWRFGCLSFRGHWQAIVKD